MIERSGGPPCQRGLGASGRQSPWYLLGFVWPFISLSFLIPDVVSTVQAGLPPRTLTLELGGLAAFAALWGWRMTREPAWVHPPPRWEMLAVLAALATALCVGSGGQWLSLFIYVSILAGFTLPARFARVVIAMTTVLAVVLGMVYGATLASLGILALLMVMMGVSQLVISKLIETNVKLTAAREGLANLAVSEERLRFARDLHDLLGHSLSAIALKTELARRLTVSDPRRAEQELGEIEVMVRDALREVREAVAGYRQPALTEEVENARAVLSAAGIAYLVEGAVSAMPSAAEAVLAWTVREGVTNVVRHSRATRCVIRLTADSATASVDVMDDGQGRAAEATFDGRAGSGLRGLAERVAARGGAFAAEPLPAGGFRLCAIVPIDDGGVTTTPIHDQGEAAVRMPAGAASR